MLDRDQIAALLAQTHRETEPSISCIRRLTSDADQDGHEPVKLLEVNPATSPSGILPVYFTAAPPAVPYPSVVVEVTEDEYQRIIEGTLRLPAGWRLGAVLYPQAA